MSNQNTWLRGFVVDNLNIDKKEINLASEKYAEIDAKLEGKTFLNGSRARHTATKPLNDVDIFWVLDSKSELVQKSLIGQDDINIDTILTDLEKHLKREYQNTTAKVIRGQHSVGVYFSGKIDEFSADIVPAIPNTDGTFKIPRTAHMSVSKRRKYYDGNVNSSEVEWINSHPKAYIESCKNLDERTEKNFRHAVRIVKAWRRVCKKADDSLKLKSFHLECVVADIFDQNVSFNCLEVVDYFFKNIESEYLQTPSIPDKAGGRNIDDYMVDDPEFSLRPIRPLLTQAQSLIHSIKNADTEEELISFAQKLTLEPPKLSTAPFPTDRVPASSRPYFPR